MPGSSRVRRGPGPGGERRGPDAGGAPALVLGLPRGGVAVGAEVARILGAPLDVLVTRKIGYPPRPELGLGAIAEGGEPVYDHAAAGRDRSGAG